MERLEDVFGRFDVMSRDECREAIRVVDAVLWLKPHAMDTLRACHDEGPLFDGDLPSKTDRNDLLECGAVEKVVVKGESGLNACTHFGRDMLIAAAALGR